jgi:hypothetical protein
MAINKDKKAELCPVVVNKIVPNIIHASLYFEYTN